ncbi:MAG: PQQ-dependent sugar dehydrogenase [Pseudomonadota bacterium]
MLRPLKFVPSSVFAARLPLLGAATALAAAMLAPHPVSAETFSSSAGPLKVERVVGGLSEPWAVAFLPSGGVLITEQRGRLLLVEDGVRREVAGAPEVRARGQGGLLDVTLDPDFEENRTLYLSYSEPAEGGARTAAAKARLAIEPEPRLEDLQVIFRQDPVLRGGRHFGSRIVVADDGSLWITTGDRGDRPRAQDPEGHVGKVIRIAKDGSIPADNPFLDDPIVRDEIWSIGHRNAQGAAKHPETGALWTVEHGAAGGDEINQPEAGKNYGWPVISYGRHYAGGKIGEGTSKAGLEQPKHFWDPSIAPSGMTFYTGDLFPEWKGDIFVGALKYELVSRLDIRDGEVVGEERLFADAFGRVRDVRTGPDGALYFLTDAREGGLYRVSPAE